MQCPSCKMEMEAGRAQVKGTILGFLLVGLSYQHLYFLPSQGAKEKIIPSRGIRPAHYCRQCRGLFIEPY